MSVSVECCVLLSRGLWDGLITSPVKSYRLRCVVVCDLEASRMRRPRPELGRSDKRGEIYIKYFTHNDNFISIYY